MSLIILAMREFTWFDWIVVFVALTGLFGAVCSAINKIKLSEIWTTMMALVMTYLIWRISA